MWCAISRSLCALIAASGVVAWGQTGPAVSNVTAAQRQDSSRLVDVRYDLTASTNCTVWVVVSDNGGTTWSVPAQTITGAVGRDVSPGTNKLVTWDAGADIPGKTGNLRVRVYADDGANSNVVLVPSGDYPYQNGGHIFVPAFMIDRYEVTNQRYCEFLNAADPEGTHWDSRQEITRSGMPLTVYYAVNSGRQNYPARYISHDDAAAMAAWLSQRDGRTWRLPTEEEWEKAAAWDLVLQKHWTYGFLNDTLSCAWSNTYSCFGDITEVGRFNGNDGTNNAYSYFGCYDMTGNVWEWTSSILSGTDRVIRGGSWLSTPEFCPTSYREGSAPTERMEKAGFRLVLDLQ